MQRADSRCAVEGFELQRVAVLDGETLRLQRVVTAGAGGVVEIVLGRQGGALDLIVRVLLARPGNALGHEKTPQAAIGRLYAEALVRAEANFLALMVGPDLQQVLLAMQTLAGHLDGQAQQARVFGVAFHPAKLDEAQWPRTGFPVDGQWRQTQQAELLGWQVRPGVRCGRRFACRSFGIWRWCLRGWVFAHGRPVYRSVAFDALSAIFLSTGANEGQDPFAQRTGQG